MPSRARLDLTRHTDVSQLSPAPRAVPLGAMRSSAFFMLLFGGIWCAVGTLLTVVFLAVGGPPWDDWILDRRGVRVEAQPVGVEATSSRVNRQRVYEVRFRFKDRRGAEQHASMGTADSAILADAREGRALSVEYDPEEPSRVRFTGQLATIFGAAILLPLFFAAAGATIFLPGLVSARRTRRVYRDGDIAEARVTSVERTAVRQNRRRIMRMRYEFQGPAGLVAGEWRTAQPSQPGASIWVIYDRERPEENVPAAV